MDKKILSFEGVENEFVTLDFNGQEIIVKNRLDLEDIVKLINVYVNEYIADNENNSQAVFAEYGFKSAVFDVAVMNFEIGADDFPRAVATTLFDDVISRISNIREVKHLINKTIEKIERKSSLDSMIQQVGNQLIQTLQDISKMGINEEMIAKMVEAVKEVKALKINQ